MFKLPLSNETVTYDEAAAFLKAFENILSSGKGLNSASHSAYQKLNSELLRYGQKANKSAIDN
jgi:hypothetical protein